MENGKERVETATHVNRALMLYVGLVVSITAASWSVYYFNPTFDRRPLYGKYDQFRDLTNYAGKTEHLWHGADALGRGFPTYNYPPPGAFVFKTFNHLVPTHPVKTYLFFFFATLFCSALVVWRAACTNPATRTMAAAAIAVTLVLGEPTWFTADRGNIEWVVCALAGLGLCFLLRRRNKFAAAFIAVASSIKPFSILFLGLLLRRRKYTEVMLAFAIMVVIITLAAVALGPNPWRAYEALKPGAADYVNTYVRNLLPPDQARFCHSILDGMKMAAVTAKIHGIHPTLASNAITDLRQRPAGWNAVHLLVRGYPWILLAGLALLVTRFYRMPVLNQVTAVAMAVSLCPPVAGEYTLLQLYVPFGAFLIFLTREVATGQTQLSSVAMNGYAMTYALLFVPLTFLRVYAGSAKLILSLALLWVAAKYPMRSAYFGDFSPEANS